jgi:hypothetical protein
VSLDPPHPACEERIAAALGRIPGGYLLSRGARGRDRCRRAETHRLISVEKGDGGSVHEGPAARQRGAPR